MTLTWAMVVAQLAEWLLPSMDIFDLQFESSHWHIFNELLFAVNS